MAERRMFAKTIIDSDAFLDMPLSTQALYFHLSMRADDDGFINNPKKIQRMVGSSNDDLNLLVAKKFVIPFESGVCVIKHWKIHNYIQNDRYKETMYKDEKALLNIKENKSYTLGIPTDNSSCIQDGYNMETQVRLGKDRLELGKDKNSIDETKVSCSGKAPPNITNEVINYLNGKTGKKFKATTKETKKVIKARQLEGYTLDDFKKVINNKVKDWLNNPKMNEFLRPNTLFGTKFEGYLNQKYVNTQSSNNKVAPGFNNFQPRDYDYDSLEKKLLGWDDDEN